MFGATNIVKNSDKSWNGYCGYGTAFDGAGSWNFINCFVGNVVIFGVYNSLSSHTDNRKNNFLVLDEEPTDGITGSVGAAKQKFSINFSKVKTKFCLILHYIGGNSYLFVNRKKIFRIIS